MEEEIWKPVIYKKFPDHVAHLEVSNIGKVRRRASKKEYKFTTKDKYHIVTVANKVLKVHIMVAETFLGERPEGYDIDHINGDRYDNRAVNLRYLDHVTNAKKGNAPEGRFQNISHEERLFNMETEILDVKKILSEMKGCLDLLVSKT
jgi:hypothetical protein